MTRHIILDTETTGLSPEQGHRVVEIGAVEMINFSPTGEQLHLYMNPEREMEPEAERIHGLSTAFLSDKPLFADIAQQFIDFIGDDIRLDPVKIDANESLKEMLKFFMGKNTPTRQEYIIRNLRFEHDILDEDEEGEENGNPILPKKSKKTEASKTEMAESAAA
mgnify:CR=1 FL=1